MRMIATLLCFTLISCKSASNAKLANFSNENNSYQQECSQLQVPAPPKWGDPKWENLGAIKFEKMAVRLNPSKNNFAPDNFADLWMAKFSSDAMCVANPRRNDQDHIYTIAIICYNKQTGGTCFWDSDLKGRPAEHGYDFIASGFGGGISTEECTACHRGPTPWIRIPGDITSKALREWAGNPNWRPLGSSEWRIAEAKELGPFVKGCSECHKMPKATKEYCDVVARRYFAQNVMPPGGRNKDEASLNAYCSQAK